MKNARKVLALVLILSSCIVGAAHSQTASPSPGTRIPPRGPTIPPHRSTIAERAAFDFNEGAKHLDSDSSTYYPTREICKKPSPSGTPKQYSMSDLFQLGSVPEAHAEAASGDHTHYQGYVEVMCDFQPDNIYTGVINGVNYRVKCSELSGISGGKNEIGSLSDLVARKDKGPFCSCKGFNVGEYCAGRMAVMKTMQDNCKKDLAYGISDQCYTYPTPVCSLPGEPQVCGCGSLLE